jgi:hypothetical protein
MKMKTTPIFKTSSILGKTTVSGKTTTFWMQQLRFAQANLDYLKYSTGRANIDQKRLRTLTRTQKSQMEQCQMAIHAEDLRERTAR